jgi:hypothetical protein
MATFTQWDCVVLACTDLGMIADGRHNVRTESDRALVILQLEDQYQAGTFKIGAQHTEYHNNEQKRSQYFGCVIASAIKQDERLNGGIEYTPAVTRGPRVTDEKLKKLNEIVSILEKAGGNDPRLPKLTAMRDQRKAEVDAEKGKPSVAMADKLIADLGIDFDL